MKFDEEIISDYEDKLEEDYKRNKDSKLPN